MAGLSGAAGTLIVPCELCPARRSARAAEGRGEVLTGDTRANTFGAIERLAATVVPGGVVPIQKMIRGAVATAFVVMLASLANPMALATGDEGGEDIPRPIDFSHNGVDAPAPVTSAQFGSAQSVRPGTAICTTATQSTPNVNTDCEGVNPHNETSIAVNPRNPANMIGGANDYQLSVNPGGHVGETTLSRAHVTFDGGRTWSEYPLLSTSSYQATGDPAVAFDQSGHAYYATLGFRFVGPTNAQNPDIVVANSGDGGRTWTARRVAHGSGVGTSVGDLLDKEYIAAWGAGNAIVTFGDFRLGPKGALVSGRIYSSITHDFGASWSTPQVISGDRDEAFVAVPTVAADGRIFVAFLNTVDDTTGRDDYEVVEVSPSSGARLAGPFTVSHVVDGFTDYPIALDRQTYQDSLFRTWAAGNITADPTNAAHLAVVWSDMRNSQRPAPADPYQAVTNSDVVVSQSFDRGRTWSSPTALALARDQFMPWGAYDTAGRLRVGTFDRRYDPSNHRYGYSLATETGPGSMSFSAAQVTTALSDPTRDNRWFAATVNPAFPRATTFLGDYSNVAALPNGGIVAYWTDLREEACFLSTCAHGQDAYFAQVS
jgi:hypothetical protein